MAFFEKLGWHDSPARIVGDFVNWLEQIVGVSAFPWVASGTLGAAAGTWAHWIATSIDKDRPSKAERFRNMAGAINNVRSELFEGAKNKNGEVDFDKRNWQSDLKIRALYAELRKLGLRPPNFDNQTSLVFNVGHYSWLQCIEAFAERGLLAEVKRQAKIVEAEIKAASRLDPPPPKIEEEKQH